MMKRPGNQSRNQNNFLTLQKRKPGLGTAPMYLSWLTAEPRTRATVPVPRANPCSAMLPARWARGGEWAWPGMVRLSHALGKLLQCFLFPSQNQSLLLHLHQSKEELTATMFISNNGIH